MFRRRFGTAAIAVLLAAFIARPAQADWLESVTGKDPGLLEVGGGMFDFLHNYKAGEARVEYQFAHGLFFLHPIVGAFGTTKGGGFGYAGFNLDLHITQHLIVAPTASMGYYAKGSGKDLGGPFEFKTGAQFAYRFRDDSRIGIQFDHISNAGIYKKNPGEENLILMFTFPVGSL